MKTDILIVGAGPAGIFTAIELLKRGDKRKITVVEKGAAIENRICPKNKTGLCAGCKNCSITTGFSGAGAFSDGKLSLSEDVGGDLPELVGHDAVKEAIRYVDKIYLDFGADCKVEGVGDNDKIKEIRKKAIQANLKLVDCPIRHLGTEKAQEIYLAIEKHLLKNGVELFFGTDCDDLFIDDGVCKGAYVRQNGERFLIQAGTTSISITNEFNVATASAGSVTIGFSAFGSFAR